MVDEVLKDEVKEDEDWKKLDFELPLKLEPNGPDLKSNLSYNLPKWSCESVDPKILDLSVQVISNGVILETVKLGDKPFYTLGSTDSCDFVYKNPQVSRKHFVLHFSRSNSLIIFDLRSKCGTTLNHKPLKPERYYTLSLGDQIRIGKPGLSTRSYVIIGHSVLSELESDKADSSEVKGGELEKIKGIKALEKEFEGLDDAKSWYETNLFLEEYDEFFDKERVKKRKKEKLLTKADLASEILSLQRAEVEILNSWYDILREGEGKADSGDLEVEMEVKRVKMKELEKDKVKFQADLDKVRKDLERKFRLLRVASF